MIRHWNKFLARFSYLFLLSYFLGPNVVSFVCLWGQEIERKERERNGWPVPSFSWIGNQRMNGKGHRNLLLALTFFFFIHQMMLATHRMCKDVCGHHLMKKKKWQRQPCVRTFSDLFFFVLGPIFIFYLWARTKRRDIKKMLMRTHETAVDRVFLLMFWALTEHWRCATRKTLTAVWPRTRVPRPVPSLLSFY